MPADASPVLVRLCQRCLERDPQLRLRDIGEARVALEGSSVSMLTSALPGVPPAPAAPARGRRRPLGWLAAAVAVAALSFGALGMTGRLSPVADPLPLVHAEISMPASTGLYLNPGFPGVPVVAPDARHIAFAAQDSNGSVMLYVRSLAERESRPIAGTQGASYPFWAPDSRSVAFFAREQLNRVDIGGGPVMTICQAENGKWGSWNDEERILFTPSHNAGIFVVPATGGEPVAVTRLEDDEGARSHRFPRWLPDGRHFVYLSWYRGGSAGDRGSDTALRLGSVDGDADRELMPSQTGAVFAADHLLYVHETNLMCRPFSWRELDFTGPPRPLMDDVLGIQGAHYGVFSAVDADVLAYVRSGGSFGLSNLVWVDAEGEETPLSVPPTSNLGFAVSPDGSRVVYSRVDDQTGTFDIWVHEIARSLSTRFTFGAESEYMPVWSADGAWITYCSDESGTQKIYRKRVSGSGTPELLVSLDTDCTPTAWSPDDGRLLFTKVNPVSGYSSWILDTTDGSEPRPLRETEFSEGGACFSPDGWWIAYMSDETGQPETFVETLHPEGGRWRISSNGGMWPVWSRDGSRIYYLELTGGLKVTEVVVDGAELDIGRTESVTGGVEIQSSRTLAENPATGQVLVQKPLHELDDSLQLVTGWRRMLAAGGD